jgi:hypothetical protein
MRRWYQSRRRPKRNFVFRKYSISVKVSFFISANSVAANLDRFSRFRHHAPPHRPRTRHPPRPHFRSSARGADLWPDRCERSDHHPPGAIPGSARECSASSTASPPAAPRSRTGSSGPTRPEKIHLGWTMTIKSLILSDFADTFDEPEEQESKA